jgi:hypothetical protein
METEWDARQNLNAFLGVLLNNGLVEGSEITDIVKAAAVLSTCIVSCEGEINIYWVEDECELSFDRLKGVEVNGEYLAVFGDYMSLSEYALSAIFDPKHPPTYVISAGLEIRFSKAVCINGAILLESDATAPLNTLESDLMFVEKPRLEYQSIITRSYLGALVHDRRVHLRLTTGKAILIEPKGLFLTPMDVVRLIG